MKICKDSALTINQSKVINGENYIVVNYKANSNVVRIWVLWAAQDLLLAASQELQRAQHQSRGRRREH